MPIEQDNPLGSNQIPTHVQAEQQVVFDEVQITLPGGSVGGPRNMFDKASGTTVAFVGIATIDFTHPLLVTRIALMGAVANMTISVVDVTGATTVIAAAVVAATGWDSGIIDPQILATRVVLNSVNPSTISEVTILKAINVVSTVLAQQSEYAEMVGQKIYWDPLNSNTGGAPMLQYHLLTRIPLETNAEDVPAINVDSEIATITNDIADIERLSVHFHEFSQSTKEVRNFARTMITIEMSANARCTTLRSRLYRRDITTNVLTAITAEKAVTMNTDGAVVRHVRFVHQDFTQVNLTANEVLVWQVRVFGRQVAANVIPSYLTLWFRRGTFDCKIDTEIVSEAEA